MFYIRNLAEVSYSRLPAHIAVCLHLSTDCFVQGQAAKVKEVATNLKKIQELDPKIDFIKSQLEVCGGYSEISVVLQELNTIFTDTSATQAKQAVEQVQDLIISGTATREELESSLVQVYEYQGLISEQQMTDLIPEIEALTVYTRGFRRSLFGVEDLGKLQEIATELKAVGAKLNAVKTEDKAIATRLEYIAASMSEISQDAITHQWLNDIKSEIQSIAVSLSVTGEKASTAKLRKTCDDVDGALHSLSGLHRMRREAAQLDTEVQATQRKGSVAAALAKPPSEDELSIFESCLVPSDCPLEVEEEPAEAQVCKVAEKMHNGDRECEWWPVDRCVVCSACQVAAAQHKLKLLASEKCVFEAVERVIHPLERMMDKLLDKDFTSHAHITDAVNIFKDQIYAPRLQCDQTAHAVQLISDVSARLKHAKNWQQNLALEKVLIETESLPEMVKDIRQAARVVDEIESACEVCHSANCLKQELAKDDSCAQGEVKALEEAVCNTEASLEELEAAIAAVEVLEAQLIVDGQPDEAKKVRKVLVRAKVSIRKRAKAKVLKLDAQACADVEEALDAGAELEAQLSAGGDVELAGEVGAVVACMEGMVRGGEVSCEELDVVIGQAEVTGMKLHMAGKEAEAEQVEEIVVKLKKARKVKVRARVIKRKAAKLEADTDSCELTGDLVDSVPVAADELSLAGVEVEAVSGLADVMGSADATEEEQEAAVDALEALEVALMGEDKIAEARMVHKVNVRARDLLAKRSSAQELEMEGCVQDDVELAAEGVVDLEDKLLEGGDVELAGEVGAVVACMEGMVGREVSCEELDVAIADAEVIEAQLRADGKEAEADMMVEVVENLKKARLVQVRARVLKKKRASKEADVELLAALSETVVSAGEASAALLLPSKDAAQTLSTAAAVFEKVDSTVEELLEAVQSLEALEAELLSCGKAAEERGCVRCW